MTKKAWASLVGRTIKSFSVVEHEAVFITLDDGRTVVIEIEGAHMEGGGWLSYEIIKGAR